jgi:hypothetical protein
LVAETGRGGDRDRYPHCVLIGQQEPRPLALRVRDRDLLVLERGWSTRQYGQFIGQAMIDAVLGPGSWTARAGARR